MTRQMKFLKKEHTSGYLTDFKIPFNDVMVKKPPSKKGQTQHQGTSESIQNNDEFMQNFWGDMGLDFNSESGQVSHSYDEINLHHPGINGAHVAASNDHDFNSKTMQHSQARNRAARWNSDAKKSGGFGDHATGSAMHLPPADSDFYKHNLLERSPVQPASSSSFMDYVDEVNKFGDGLSGAIIHLPTTLKNMATSVSNAAKSAYNFRNESGTNIAMMAVIAQQNWLHNSTGAEKFGAALNIVGSEAYLGAFGAGTYVAGANILSKVKYGDNFYHTVTSSGMGQGVLGGIDPLRLNPSSRYGRAMYLADDAETTLSELSHHNVAGC